MGFTRFFQTRFLRAAACVIVCTLVLGLAGCDDQAPVHFWSPGDPLPKEKLRVGVLFIDGTSNSGYSFAHDAALRKTQQELGIADSQIIRKLQVNETDPQMADSAVRDCIAQGANVIIATSDAYLEPCTELAAEFPKVIFVLANGDTYNAANLTNFWGKLYQARYLSGIIAGLKTRSGMVGFVAAKGLDDSTVTNNINAFALGVERVNPNAMVLVRVTHSWYDPAGERQAARLLIDSGCDVITLHCNTPSALLEAEEAGVWGIGYNNDMAAEAPDTVLSSVVWNWDVYYTRLLQSVIDGSFNTRPYLGGLKDGMVELAPLNPALTDSAMADTLIAERARIESGDFDVFDGELVTNEGKTVGVAGKKLAYERIADSMDWYYRTVVVFSRADRH